jgi:DNA primase
MELIAIAKRNIDLADIIIQSGVQLSSKYGKHTGLCPFHNDTTPSFYVYDDHFHCYGCHAHGDAIDFIQGIHGCDFRDACRHLGISTGKPTMATHKKTIELKKKQAEKKRYQQRERDPAFTLGTVNKLANL